MATVSLAASGRKWYVTTSEPVELYDVKTGSAADTTYAADTELYTLVTTFNTNTKSFAITPTVMP